MTNGAGSNPVYDATPDLGTPSAMVLTAGVTGSLSLGTGTITGNVLNVVETGTTQSPTGTDLNGAFHMYSNVASVTVSLDSIANAGDGASACFYDIEGTAVLLIDPHADDQIRLDGVLKAAGVTITSTVGGNAGDFVCLIARDNGADDEWIVLGQSGTWTSP